MDEHILEIKLELIELKKQHPDWKVNPNLKIETLIEKLHRIIRELPPKQRKNVPQVLPAPAPIQEPDFHCKCCIHNQK